MNEMTKKIRNRELGYAAIDEYYWSNCNEFE